MKTTADRLEIPARLETERLVLRSFCPSDAEALHLALRESITELRQFLWFLPWVAEEQTLESARLRCQQAKQNFIAQTDLPYLVFARGSAELIGSVGLHRTDWLVPKTEVGYWVRTSKAGNGYTLEGVRALVGWAVDELQARRIEIVTDEANTASRQIAERCGFELEGILRNVERAPDGSLRNNCIYARLPSIASE